MNIIYDLLNINAGSIADRFHARRTILGISDELAFRKMIFGFFENGVTPYRIQQQAPTAYERLEFFAGSLSAHIFRESIMNFLKTKEAQELDSTTLQILSAFIHSSETGAEHSYFVDLIRSQDIRYILLALTGEEAFTAIGGEFLAEKSEIDTLVRLALDKIQALQPCETVSFLTGSITHETQVAVHRLSSEKWELYYSDSARDSLIIYPATQEEVLDSDFWTKVFIEKVSEGDSNFLNIFFNAKEDFRKKTIKNRRQKHDTCHIRSQIGLLKIFFVCRSSLGCNRIPFEWKQFKVLFGNFLLNENSVLLEEGLTQICQIGHERHKHKYGELSLFYKGIFGGEYEEIKEAYFEIFRRFGLSDDLVLGGSDLENLITLHKRLLRELDTLYITLDHWESNLGKVENQHVIYTLKCFKESYQAKIRVSESKLLNEIEKYSAAPNFFSFLEPIITSLTLSKAVPRVREPVVATLDRLHQYLVLLEKNPKWLAGLKDKESFANTLMQGMCAGLLKEVDSIFSQLEPEDAHWFALEALKVVKSSKIFLPRRVEHYIIEKIENGFGDEAEQLRVCFTLLEKAIQSLRFSSLFEIYNLASQRRIGITRSFLSKMHARVASMPLEEVKALKVTISMLDPTHEMRVWMENVLAYYHYQRGEFHELLAYDYKRLLSIFPSNTPYVYTSQTCLEAWKLLEIAPLHPMRQQIYIDLILYAFQEKNPEILYPTLHLLQNEKGIGLEHKSIYLDWEHPQLDGWVEFFQNSSPCSALLKECIQGLRFLETEESHTLAEKIEKL